MVTFMPFLGKTVLRIGAALREWNISTYRGVELRSETSVDSQTISGQDFPDSASDGLRSPWEHPNVADEVRDGLSAPPTVERCQAIHPNRPELISVVYLRQFAEIGHLKAMATAIKNAPRSLPSTLKRSITDMPRKGKAL